MIPQEKAISIAKEVKQIAQKIYGDELTDVVLYGSYARNEAWEESDLDLMVLFKMPHNASKEISKMQTESSKLQLDNLIYISFLISDENKFSSVPLPIYYNIKKEGIKIV
ncbi:MAG: hypothetical protein RL708_2361 [Bacteroidota bacterium]|jgi:predicted nucleotidyltransferase